jgi:G3E family GTPase
VSDANSTSAQPAPFVPLANGCICCSVKDIGVAAIENLMEQSGLFDYILLETTGLADPGNIAPMFWLDDGLGSSIFLDGIVTLVDAKNVLKSLDEGLGDEEKIEERKKEHAGHDEHGPLLTTAHLQISHADVVIINKTDLVSEEDLEKVTERIRSINGLARIKTTTKSQVPELEGLVLDLHAYDDVTDADLKFAAIWIQRSVLQLSLSRRYHASRSTSSITSCVRCFGKRRYLVAHHISLSRFTDSKGAYRFGMARCSSYKVSGTSTTRTSRELRLVRRTKRRSWC